MDTVCLMSILSDSQRDRCFSAAAEDYFYANPIKRFGGRLFANTFPFNRTEDPNASLAACRRILEQGCSLIFYPEGTRSTDGQIALFRRGIGAIVAGTPHPVVPVHIAGTFEAMPKNQHGLRRAPVRLTVGAPMVFRNVEQTDVGEIEIARQLQERICSFI